MNEFPCVHRGEQLDIRLCDLCGEKGQPFEVFACSLHGECSMHRKHSQIKSCIACADRVAENGERIPLPVPAEIDRLVQVGAQSESYMVAVFRIEGKRVLLDRKCVNFPFDDYRTCAELLAADLLAEFNKNRGIVVHTGANNGAETDPQK